MEALVKSDLLGVFGFLWKLFSVLLRNILGGVSFSVPT